MNDQSSSNRRTFLIGLGVLGLSAGGAYWVLEFMNLRKASEERRELQEQRRRQVQAIKRLDTAGMVDRVGLADFLAYWNDAVIARLKSARFPLDRIQAEIVQTGTIFLPPATGADISALEERLAIRLPVSVATFFGRTNGVKGIIDYSQEDLDFFPCNKVMWLHELDRQLVDIWTKERFNASDAEYSRYGEGQDVIQIRTDYMKRIVAMGPVVDSGVYLLNPNVTFPDGEMEAWDFSVKYPGAKRYQSFNRLLEAHCRDSCWNLEYWSLSHGWEQSGETR